MFVVETGLTLLESLSMTSSGYVIRFLVESDLNAWFQLRKKLWDETTDDDHKAEMLDVIEHTDTQMVFVAESDKGELVGFLEASIRPFVEDCHSDRVGYLEGWFVEPGHRRNGVGKGLVQYAEQWAMAKGCTEMASDAEIGNQLSLDAHRQLGYEVTARLVHLRKELDQSK